MRRHYAPYFRDMPNIKPYRSRLVTEMEPAVLFEILEEIEYVYANLPFVFGAEPEPVADWAEACDA